MRCASLRESTPNFRHNKFCSRQSSRDNRIVIPCFLAGARPMRGRREIVLAPLRVSALNF
jgi:hypothetical protein